MGIEHKCSECRMAKPVKTGEVFEHRYKMIAVNFGIPFVLRSCTTKDEIAIDPETPCDRPDEFVDNKNDIG